MEWLSGSGIFISLCFLNYFCQVTLIRSRKNYFSIFFFVKIFPKLSDVIYRFDKFVQSRVKWTATFKIRTDTRQNFPENPDKNRTRPRQCCPLNSGSKMAILSIDNSLDFPDFLSISSSFSVS